MDNNELEHCLFNPSERADTWEVPALLEAQYGLRFGVGPSFYEAVTRIHIALNRLGNTSTTVEEVVAASKISFKPWYQ